MNESSTSTSSVRSESRRLRVDETQEEEDAGEPPDPPVGEHLAGERPVVAARHRPRHLRPGPRLGHLPGEVDDGAPGDLAGPPRPDVDGPGARDPVEVGPRCADAPDTGRATASPWGRRGTSRSPRPSSASGRRRSGATQPAERPRREPAAAEAAPAAAVSASAQSSQRTESPPHRATAAGSSRACCRRSSAASPPRSRSPGL